VSEGLSARTSSMRQEAKIRSEDISSSGEASADYPATPVGAQMAGYKTAIRPGTETQGDRGRGSSHSVTVRGIASMVIASGVRQNVGGNRSSARICTTGST
jgi:hypothetical protein